jgi:hypothetical protein
MTLAGAFFPLIYDVTHCSFINRLPGFETKTEKPTSASLKGSLLGGVLKTVCSSRTAGHQRG